MSTRTPFKDALARKAGLFDLSSEWIALLAQIEQSDGELTPETEDAFKRLTDELGAKVDDYGALIQALELQCLGYKDRIAAFSAALLARTRTVDRLKARLLDAMTQMGSRRIVGETYTARIGESTAVKVDDLSRVPDTFFRVPPPELDRAKIKEDLKAGKSVPGASLETRNFLVVK